MSVLDQDTIDFAGIESPREGSAGKKLVLTIADHLEWGTEEDGPHLYALQNKIDTYLRFIESREIDEHYPTDQYGQVAIRLTSKYPISSQCLAFLEASLTILKGAEIGLEWEVFASKTANSEHEG